MSLSCDEVRAWLAALAYDEEVDAAVADAVHRHLRGCDACRERRRAYAAVRQELQGWRTAGLPPPVTFIGVPPWGTRPTRRWWLPAAVAAAVTGAMLLGAAAMDLRLSRTPRGPGAAAGLSDGRARAVRSAAAATEAGRGSGEAFSRPAGLDADDLDAWLDGALAARGLLPPSRDELSAAERREVLALVSELLDEQLQLLVRDLVAASEMQQQELAATIASLYEELHAQRLDALMAVVGELGLVQADTGAELRRANAAIDYLFAQVSAPAPGRRQERR